MRINRILIAGILITYMSRFNTLENKERTTNAQKLSLTQTYERNISRDKNNDVLNYDTEMNEKNNILEAHNGERIPFGSGEFYLYILYAASILISNMWHCRVNVRSYRWLFFNQPSATRN